MIEKKLTASGKALFMIGIVLVLFLAVSVLSVINTPSNSLSPSTADKASSEQKTTTQEQKDNATIYLPRIDIARIETNAPSLVAGRAPVGGQVEILLDQEVVGLASTDAAGAFVYFATLPSYDSPKELRLRDSKGQLSTDAILILPQNKTVVIAKDDDVIIQAAPPTQGVEQVPLSLVSIDYSENGAVTVGGLGRTDQSVRVYVDNQPITTTAVTDGQWRATLNDVSTGLYTLRVDQLDADGQVSERVESPFKRVEPNTNLGASVTIQPGNTLWRIADLKYGRGIRYIQIYEANKDQIRDPNLIYPGQIFTLPEE